MKADFIVASGTLSKETLNCIIKNKILIFNAENIDSIETLKLAIYHADKSFKKEQSFAKDYPLEIMLYLSGEKQIEVAKKIFGVDTKTKKFVIVSNDKSLLSKLGLKEDAKLKEKISDPTIFEKMVLLKLKK
jgi:tRNA threonylcarbamoyladenosine modification (KEOPS) complex Cgi121 subunit